VARVTIRRTPNSTTTGLRGPSSLSHLLLLAAAIAVAAGVWASAQTPQVFQFYISATSADGTPVKELGPDDVIMSENGVKQKIAKVEPVSVPIKLTIAVDNGLESADAIAHYRIGLKGLVEALPPDVEVTLITTAPQPRMVIKPTTDRVQLLRGVTLFAPESSRPRWSDALVEFSQRLQKEAKDKKAAPYLPILVMVSTVSLESRSYEPDDIQKAVQYLMTRKAKVNAVLASTRTSGNVALADTDVTQQANVALPTTKATGGRFETLALANKLDTLLPEWGHDLAALETRQAAQFRVTVERSKGGELQKPTIEIAREGLKGTVTIDGYLP
jgi:hypothetical protein